MQRPLMPDRASLALAKRGGSTYLGGNEKPFKSVRFPDDPAHDRYVQQVFLPLLH